MKGKGAAGGPESATLSDGSRAWRNRLLEETCEKLGFHGGWLKIWRKGGRRNLLKGGFYVCSG